MHLKKWKGKRNVWNWERNNLISFFCILAWTTDLIISVPFSVNTSNIDLFHMRSVTMETTSSPTMFGFVPPPVGLQKINKKLWLESSIWNVSICVLRPQFCRCTLKLCWTHHSICIASLKNKPIFWADCVWVPLLGMQSNVENL